MLHNVQTCNLFLRGHNRRMQCALHYYITKERDEVYYNDRWMKMDEA